MASIQTFGGSFRRRRRDFDRAQRKGTVGILRISGKPFCCGISSLSSQAFQKRLQVKGLRPKIDRKRTGSSEPTKTERRLFLRLRRSFCALPKACVHTNWISLTNKVGKQQNWHRRHRKVSNQWQRRWRTHAVDHNRSPRTSRPVDGLYLVIAFDKSCSHAKIWTMAYFVRVAFDSTSLIWVVSVDCGLASTRQSSFISNGVRRTKKVVGILLRLPLPNKASMARFGATSACRSSQASCSQRYTAIFFLDLGRGETWLSSQVLLSTLCWHKRGQQWKNITSLSAVCDVTLTYQTRRSSSPPPPLSTPPPPEQDMKRFKSKSWKRMESFFLRLRRQQLDILIWLGRQLFSAAVAALRSRTSRHSEVSPYGEGYNACEAEVFNKTLNFPWNSGLIII